MKIVLLDFAGPYFPGGCEKFFSFLANNFSIKNKVHFVESKQYIKAIERVYHFISGHKIGSINYVKRDIGKASSVDISIKSLLPFSKDNRKIKSLLNKSDCIYVKNEFQELSVIYFLLGGKGFSQKVIIGVRTAIFIPNSVRGIWRFIHDMQYYSFLYKLFLRSAKKIHVPNSDYVKLIKDKYGVREGKIIMVPNPITWETSLIKVGKGSFKIIWFGRMTPQKGIDRLRNILLSLSREDFFEKIEVYIAGEGREENGIKELDLKYKNIHMMGFVNNINNLLEAADIVISTSYFETFGNNILEAQSFGVPVVSYNISGPNDIIVQSKTGFLVESDAEFVREIGYIYNMKKKDFNKFNEMREFAFKNTQEKFSKNKILKELENRLLYNN